MKVRELQEILSGLDPDMEVAVYQDGLGTYSPVCKVDVKTIPTTNTHVDGFNRGARAMFDHIMARAANRRHTCQYDRELMENLAENALNDVSPESCQAWRSINDAMESAQPAAATRLAILRCLRKL